MIRPNIIKPIFLNIYLAPEYILLISSLFFSANGLYKEYITASQKPAWAKKTYDIIWFIN